MTCESLIIEFPHNPRAFGSWLAMLSVMYKSNIYISVLKAFQHNLLSILLTCVLPLSALALPSFYEGTSQNIQTVFASLNGQPLKNYPKLVLVSQSPLLNVYWANNVECSREPMSCEGLVDQAIAVQVQKHIENSVKSKIERFDLYADKLLPQWRSKFRAKLFPLSIQIQLGEEMFYAGSIFEETGAQAIGLDGSSVVQMKLKSRISIGIQNPSFSSIDTLIMHEFGHMLLRALEFPRMESAKSGRADALLEEALPDFISSSTNDDTAVIAPGLQDSVARMVQEKLADPKLEPFQRAKMAMDLRGISHFGLRDFSRNYAYTDLYLLPGAYNTSITINAMLYRLRGALGSDYLRNTLIRAIVERPGMLNQADAYSILKNLIGYFAKIYPEQFKNRASEIQKVIKNSDWIPATKTSQEILLKSSVDAENSINVEINPALELSSIFPTTMRSLTYTVYVAEKPRFAFSDFLDYDLKRDLRFNPVAACEPSSVLCICGPERSLISIEGIYLSAKKTVESTKRANLKLSSPIESACYVLSFEWQER